ncbi:Stk1 family PASTA domain-containing Ser/Thr kinase [Cellulomonas sp. B6]|uniref:Stk1 family PASTA domain-containing Ser/Thr kinase n=1 Tax=Cellulomonas sp. B6 TaxID=1295626 RepID=UPI00073BDA83|nr:Stk1 family PASTA domain-containing Ser/Thr kinase [Cellulomonas sp. B6]KSW29076.1 serine/threonine protein kinase [Cellulomonas sp. B6]
MVDDGSRILAGRYEVGELIGRGGMAEVHIGHDNRLGRTVAIKILRSDLARDPSFQNRFRREAQSAAALNHPAIVAVYDTGEDVFTEPTGTVAHVPFIVMEYVEGHTVRDILRDGHAVPIDEAVEITAGVLSALEYSHHAGIVHRDIKPANVMITPTGAVKVMDFGIARAVADSAATMTQTQAVIGTAQYLSPEQARGEQVDTRSDLYSTGCLLFELLTGRPPFVGDSPVAVAYQHVRENPPVPSTIANDVPESLDRVTLKALAKERDARYSSAAEFRADLDAALRGGHVGAPAVGAAMAAVPTADATQVMAAPVATTQAMPPATAGGAPWGPTGLAATAQEQAEQEDEEKKRPWLIWVLALVALLAVGGIVFAVMQGAKPPPETTVKVPAVAGMTQEQALQAVRDADLNPQPAQEASDQYPAGQATRTDPAEGQDVDKESTVTVYISTGPAEVTVPDVAGMTEAQAVAEMEKAGLVVDPTRQREDVPTQPKDRVTKTDPAAATPVSAGSKVVLYLASGNVVVPNVTGQNQELATQALGDLGLRVNTSEVESDQAEGTVVSQSRAEGDIIPQGTVVNLGIAVPPSTATVPTTLRGMSYDQAVQALAAAGLTNVARQDLPQGESDEPVGTVVSSDPSGGTQVAKEQKVTLRVSSGPRPSATTAPPNPGGGTGGGNGGGGGNAGGGGGGNQNGG